MSVLAIPRGRPAAQARRSFKLSLWLPWRVLVLLLSPIWLLLLGVYALFLWPLSVSPLRTVSVVAGLLWAIGGTDVQVETRDVSILLKLR